MSVYTNPSSGAAEHAAAYVAAVLDLLGERDPLAVLDETPAAISRAIEGLSAEQLDQPEGSDKWSITQILQHLADSEIASGWRIRQILAHDRPTLTGYDQDLWAERLRYEEADPNLALEQFGVLRRANLRLLVRASADELKRVGVHVERGEESLEHLCRLYAGHDLLHLRQIDRVRRVVSGSGTSARRGATRQAVLAAGSPTNRPGGPPKPSAKAEAGHYVRQTPVSVSRCPVVSWAKAGHVRAGTLMTFWCLSQQYSGRGRQR